MPDLPVSTPFLGAGTAQETHPRQTLRLQMRPDSAMGTILHTLQSTRSCCWGSPVAPFATDVHDPAMHSADQELLAGGDLRAEVSERLLRFWQFFRQRAGPAAGAALSVRDLLSWAGFINTAAPSIGALSAYAHGAHLTLLDGIGLGAGIPAEVRL